MTSPARKAPHNAQVLQRWVGERARREGTAVARLQRWISYMALASMLDQARGGDQQEVFVIKGGVAIELRFHMRARATRDLDAVYRGAWDAALAALDGALRAGVGAFTARRTPFEAVGPTRALRADIAIAYRGRPWATVPLELAPTEGAAGHTVEHVPALELDDLGLETVTTIACLPVRFQIAQKLHACTERPTDGRVNERDRDLIDLLLLRELVSAEHLPALRLACVEIFTLRATHAWPPTLQAPPSWHASYRRLAEQVDSPVRDVDAAVAAVNAFIDEIDDARRD